MSWAIDLGLLSSSSCQIRWQLIGLFVAFPVDVVEDWLGLVAFPIVKFLGDWLEFAWIEVLHLQPMSNIVDGGLDKAISFCHR